MSRAGQADAVGGVFRVVAATYVAIHSLRGQPIAGLGLRTGVRVVRLDFETDDPTDDLVATMSDDTRCFISAKRAIGNDRHLKDTVEGWVAQLSKVCGGDLLAITAEDLRGPVKDLADALRRRQDGRELARAHREAIAAVAKHVPNDLLDDLLDRIRVLHIPSATQAGQTRTLMESMAAYLVEDGNGAAVVSLLSDTFASQAGNASSSTVEDWVQTIRMGSGRVIADGSGPAGMRVAASLAAVEDYQKILVARRGQIDLTLLADDLPPVINEDLLDGLRVETAENQRGDGDPLLRVIRRWRRMLLVGQPGTGKSVALRELAAHCASDSTAPFPILLHLPTLLRSHPDGITADTLLTTAAERVSDPGLRQPLIRAMRKELDEGTAILLCDGLDECGAKAAWMAQQLKDIVDGLNPRAGVLLSTRANAVAAATRLGLPRADLNPPNDLADTVHDVLEACAEGRIHGGGRATWLAVRRRWIDDARDQHPELFRIPLLAVLLALICADTPEADLPRGRASLLHDAIEQSVTRWESQRTVAVERRWAPELTRDMLLGGYVVLGRLLDSAAEPTTSEAIEALTAMLGDPDSWRLAPRRAREVATDLLRFWDEHVAVFVVNASDRVAARSKVFTEIATAMWTDTASDADIAAWLAEALPYTDSEGAVGLAAGLNGRVVDRLLEVSTMGASASLLLGELAVRGIVELADDQVARLLEQIKRAVERAATGDTERQRAPREPSRFWFMLHSRDDPAESAWNLVELACTLRLRPVHRQARAEIVATAALNAESGDVARALCALSDAETDGRPLDDEEVTAVKLVMDQPLPPDGELVKESRRRSAFVGGTPLPAGVDRVAMSAVSQLDVLPENASRWAFDVSMKAGRGFGEKIRSALNSRGVDTREWWDRRDTFKRMLGWQDKRDDYERLLLEDIASLPSADGTTTHRPERDRYWSLSSLGDLLESTGYARVSVQEFARAFERDDASMRRGWLDAIADAYGIDKVQAAQEAAWMSRQVTDTDERPRSLNDNWFVASMSSPRGRSLHEDAVARLGAPQYEALLDALHADSDWIAWSAAEVLVNVGTPSWNSAHMFEADMEGWPLDRAALLYMVAILTAGEQAPGLLLRAAESPDADYRIAARLSVSVNPALDGDGVIYQSLRHDPDSAVRPKGARKEDPPAAYWSCSGCRTRNGMAVEDCPGCDDGSRPD